MHEKHGKNFHPPPTLTRPGFLMCHLSLVTRGGGGVAMSYTGTDGTVPPGPWVLGPSARRPPLPFGIIFFFRCEIFFFRCAKI